MSGRGLTITRIWDDPNLVEFACVVDAGEFRGAADCYTSEGAIAKFADDIERFCERLEGTVTFKNGLEDGTRVLVIELYILDGARHCAARVRLASERWRAGAPPSSLDVELRVEPAGLEEFAKQVRGLRAVGDAATLSAVR